MVRDPFTLHVALSVAGAASGELYLDDGDTDKHAAGVSAGGRKPSRRCAHAIDCFPYYISIPLCTW